MALWGWSKTAATNATADPSINWSEGQLPSTVNDSARAMMAAVAKYRDDISGALVTGGTGAAYTVSSNSSFGTLTDLNGQIIAFTPATTNTGAVTLAVDGLAAKPIRGEPGVDLPSGSLILGTPYLATYNNTDGVFYLQGGMSNPYGVPVGGMIDWTGVSAPNSAFAMPYGQALSRTTYATLWTFAQTQIALGNTLYNNGNGTTTFGILDARGRVAASPDNMGGSAALVFPGLTSGATGGVTGASQSIARGQLPNVTLSATSSFAPPNVQITNGTSVLGIAPSSPFVVYLNTAYGTPTWTISSTTESINGGTTQSALNVAQPYIGINKILRII